MIAPSNIIHPRRSKSLHVTAVKCYLAKPIGNPPSSPVSFVWLTSMDVDVASWAAKRTNRTELLL
jgi:hypothetical protein